ncbi:MAG: hypothetical protein KKG75_05550 [Nanoarchaeota archaeon]|nr:hypothetical protein [Nanoarchaeota archaeon]
MKILKTKELSLLKRKRITAEIEHFKKPTIRKSEVLKSLAAELKTPEENISILHVYPHYGREKAKIIANVYEKKEDLERFEKINKRKKKGDKKEAAQKQEAPKPEEKKE